MRRISLFLFIFCMVLSCTKVPITGRKQLNLLPESEMIGMSLTAYDEFLNENPPLSDGNQHTALIQEMGMRISESVETYMQDEGLQERIKGFQWEFNVVDDPTVNAWCMPGGKVVFYTGIIDIAQNNDQLAAVMGHEIAHAVARHGNERMSQGMATQLGVGALSVAMNENPTLTNQLFLQAAGVGSQIGMLKFSRNHESEADKMGLIFMAMAGYDPEEAVKFWERMSEVGGGG
ncbi:MAG: M48 family metallopeptidase, partial [Flavobacteriales bacterium]|nr:M48 family metallopeptidase [Flavobacteriales bacterium]